MVIKVSLEMFLAIVEAHYQTLSQPIPYSRQALEMIYAHIDKDEFPKEPKYLEVETLQEQYRQIPWEQFASEYNVQIPSNDPLEIKKYLENYFEEDYYSFTLVGVIPENKTIVCYCWYW